jgi:L-serine/L-threonine ammonia-lyase
MINKLRILGAEVIVHGKVWDEANELALKECELIKDSLYVSPFDHELIWTGHSSIITEIKQDLSNEIDEDKSKITFVVSVGGGGLLNGLIEGILREYPNTIDSNDSNDDIKIIAVETFGTNSLHESIKQKALITLNQINSIATSLGAKTISSKTLEYCLKYSNHISSKVLSDDNALKGILWMLENHRILIEPACGVSVYEGLKLIEENNDPNRKVIVILCGGSAISLDLLQSYTKL